MSSTPKFFDRMMESSTTTGTGTYTLAGAITGYQSFAGLGNGNSAYYCAQDVDANGNPSGGWEVGLGTYTSSGTTFSRDSILASSNSNNAVSWSAGTRRLFVTVPAAYTPPLEAVMGGILLGTKPIRVQAVNINTGDNDLYTCPTGKRAYVGATIAYQASGGNIIRFFQVKISGTYYRLTSNATLTTGNQGGGTTVGYAMEAGEILSVNTATNNGLNLVVEVFEYDATTPVKSPKLVGLSTGDNTLYTCPAGSVAQLLPDVFQPGVLAQRLNFVADAGGTRTWTPYVVPSGQTPGANYKLNASTGLAASSKGSTQLPAGLGPGDFIAINVDTGNAAQFAWMNIIELVRA